MYKILFFLTVSLLAVTTAALAAWLATRPAAPRLFVDQYHQALERFPGSEAAIDTGLEAFAKAFGDLTHERIAERVERLYAETLYFNDSLKTFESRAPLVDYMAATGAMLEESSVSIDQVIRDGPDVFVRWTMKFTASGMGKPVVSESVGMTHLRVDARGRIVLHQDFWDSAAGLYRNLPVVGYLLEQVDKRMDE